MFRKDAMYVRIVVSVFGFTEEFLPLVRTEHDQPWCSFFHDLPKIM